MKVSVFKRVVSSFLILGLSMVLAGCQSAVGTANGDSRASSQRAGGQQVTPVDEPVVEEQPQVVQQPVITEPVETGTSMQDGDVLDENGRLMGRMVNGEFIPNPDYQAFNPLDQTIIYFDFDQSTIKPEFVSVLAAHADNIAANPGLSLRLEGHADERGSREYNIGLGERRAQAVKRALMLNGTSAGSLNTVSFGEEKPMVQGSNESSWSQNRRVELVYR